MARVLFVDDESHLVAVWCKMLTGLGCTVTGCTDPLEALERFKGTPHNFDVVVTDQVMPKMLGDRLAQELLAIRPDLPIFLCTAFTGQMPEESGMQKGFRRILSKPTALSELLSAIRDAMPVQNGQTRQKMGGDCAEVVDNDTPRLEEDGNGQGMDAGNLNHPLGVDDKPDIHGSDSSRLAERIAGASVLLVEDDPLNQRFVKRLLEGVGLIVDLANSGQEAIHMSAVIRYDLLLMDLHMPEMDGYTTAKRIRQDKRLDKLPIIALTADTMTDLLEQCLAVGMNGCLSKPIARNHLFAELEKWLHEGVAKRRPTAAAQTTLLPDTGELPEALPGINLPEALERVDGRADVLREMLLEFGQSCCDISERILAALQSGQQSDLETAAGTLHFVKGMSGNLSANALYAASLAFERGVKERDQQAWPRLMENFDTALKPVLRSIDLLRTQADPLPDRC
ncbi:MAG: response regulator [Magnetococcus sp. YQC-3]